jgi:MerR family redox-sensitive transcriptional activator SoxR
MLIGEVARRAGIRASAIRYYEDIGVLPRANRDSGRRRYGPDVLRRLRLVGWGKAAGFTLAEIRQLAEALEGGGAPSELWREPGLAKIRELRGRIEHQRRVLLLLEKALECDCEALDECEATRA